MDIDKLHNDLKLFMLFFEIHNSSFMIESRLLFVEFCVKGRMMRKRIEMKMKLKVRFEKHL